MPDRDEDAFRLRPQLPRARGSCTRKRFLSVRFPSLCWIPSQPEQGAP